jgi:phosphoserine phosphatase
MSDSTDSPSLVLQGISPPLRWADFRIAAFDMDSTLINIECIDEIAAVAGKKAEVAAITEAAMRGEIPDFRASLMRRLALLEGLDESALQTVLDTRLQFNPGAEKLLAALHAKGIKTLLVSGGFTFFARVVQAKLGMTAMRANELEIVGGKLTGRVLPQAWGGDVVDGEQKRLALTQFAADHGAALSQCIAVGDGANDLPMMGAAGLSVAYHAKPAVRAQAKVAINAGGLDRLLEIFAA